DNLFGRRFLQPGFVSHLRFLWVSYDEPKILSSQLTQFCLMGADVGHVLFFSPHRFPPKS
ncbi:MAG: hypothetical protein ACT6T2_30235, partial [Shinella sp.]|uniref:hypothetical protein n=1 Tax=Shinella sp. TaxID=1870904 RepID=UPI004035A0BD